MTNSLAEEILSGIIRAIRSTTVPTRFVRCDSGSVLL
jgi:hypothetical protein